MARCETSRLRAFPCLVSCLPQRMLHGKNFDVVFKKMGEDSIRAIELALKGHILFVCFLFVLLFYVHGKHLRSCRDGQLT